MSFDSVFKKWDKLNWMYQSAILGVCVVVLLIGVNFAYFFVGMSEMTDEVSSIGEYPDEDFVVHQKSTSYWGGTYLYKDTVTSVRYDADSEEALIEDVSYIQSAMTEIEQVYITKDSDGDAVSYVRRVSIDERVYPDADGETLSSELTVDYYDCEVSKIHSTSVKSGMNSYMRIDSSFANDVPYSFELSHREGGREYYELNEGMYRSGDGRITEDVSGYGVVVLDDGEIVSREFDAVIRLSSYKLPIVGLVTDRDMRRQSYSQDVMKENVSVEKPSWVRNGTAVC